MNDTDRWRKSDGFDADAIFADIVAHINDDVAEPQRPARPPAQDVTPESEATDDATAEQDPWPIGQPPVLSTPDDPPVVTTPQVWRAHEVDDEHEEHFEPPPTTPLPAGDLQFWAIIAGMGGGPLLLVYLVFFNREASSYWLLSSIAMSVGGFALLVSRLPRDHEDDDDGARL